jgi:HAD superfamily hydrolase (TIGR01509 family)
MNKIEAVVFDMDGILFDTERLCTQCWYESAIAMELGDIRQSVVECIGLNRNDTKEILFRLYGEDFPYETYMEAISYRMKEKIIKQGIPIKEGVFELLEFLTKNRYKLAVASSSRRATVLAHLERAKLKEYFSVVIGGDMVLHSKPKPDIYLMACEEIAVMPENALAIEDSPNGIQAAFSAGMKTIMVPDLIAPTKEIEKMLFKKFDSLLQVKEFLYQEQNKGEKN